MIDKEALLAEVCDLLWLKHNMELGPNGWEKAHWALTERINDLLQKIYP